MVREPSSEPSSAKSANGWPSRSTRAKQRRKRAKSPLASVQPSSCCILAVRRSARCSAITWARAIPSTALLRISPWLMLIDQAEKDHTAFEHAVRRGKVKAVSEEG